MTKQSGHGGAEPPSSDRQRREAAALRANLAKRKARQRQVDQGRSDRAAPAPAAAPDPAPSSKGQEDA